MRVTDISACGVRFDNGQSMTSLSDGFSEIDWLALDIQPLLSHDYIPPLIALPVAGGVTITDTNGGGAISLLPRASPRLAGLTQTPKPAFDGQQPYGRFAVLIGSKRLYDGAYMDTPFTGVYVTGGERACIHGTA